MQTYELSDGTSDTTVEATNLADARDQARRWVADGDWGDGGCVIEVQICREGSGEWEDQISVEVPTDEEAIDERLTIDSRRPHEHKWEDDGSPTYSLGGCHYVSRTVCACGAHRREHYDSQRLPCEGPTEWVEISYPTD